jgi:hypothetical protein
MIRNKLDSKAIPISIARLTLLAILSIAVLGFFIQSLKPDAQAQQKRLFEIIGMDVPFDQRVAVDDGVLFAIHFGGDTHGNLDTCG